MSESEAVQRVGAAGLATEQVPSLDDFYEEPSGNITPGWYDAVIIEGYATGRGTQFTTADEPAQNGKRALRFCFGITVNGQQQNRQKTFFYNPDSFKPESLARIKGLREQFAKVKSWPGEGQAQNFSITLGVLSQLSKATGFSLAQHPNGGFLAATHVGKRLRVRVGTDKKGYDDITGFKPVGAK